MQELNEDEKRKERFAQVEMILSKMEEHSSEKAAIRNKAWLLLWENRSYYFHLYIRKMQAAGLVADEEDFEDCFVEIILQIIDKFSAKNGILEHYFNSVWTYRVGDIIRNKTKEINSLNGGGEEDEMEIAVEPENLKKIEQDMKLAEILVELLNSITQLNEHKSGTVSRKTYFKMFFTDYMTEYCKNFEIGKAVADREKSIFAGMEVGFLDFYMRYCCRTLQKIQKTPLKSKKEITGKGSKEELRLPLPGEVYTRYLGVSSAGNITQMKKKYQSFCKEIGIWERENG